MDIDGPDDFVHDSEASPAAHELQASQTPPRSQSQLDESETKPQPDQDQEQETERQQSNATSPLKSQRARGQMSQQIGHTPSQMSQRISQTPARSVFGQTPGGLSYPGSSSRPASISGTPFRANATGPSPKSGASATIPRGDMGHNSRLKDILLSSARRDRGHYNNANLVPLTPM